jgi:hypothetical protein
MKTIFSSTKYGNFTKSKLIERGYIIMSLPEELKRSISGEFTKVIKDMVMTKNESNR